MNNHSDFLLEDIECISIDEKDFNQVNEAHVNPLPPKFISYSINKTSHDTSLYNFSLWFRNNLKMIGKYGGNFFFNSYIDFIENNKLIAKMNFNFFRNSFVLLHSNSDTVLCKINFETIGADPCQITVTINDKNGKCKNFKSKKPVFSETAQHLVLPLKGVSMCSAKNAILLNEKSKIIQIRKIAKDTLSVDDENELPYLVLFAIGVASFIAPR